MQYARAMARIVLLLFLWSLVMNEFIDENPTSFLFSLTCRSYYTPYCIDFAWKMRTIGLCNMSKTWLK